ncbi:MAG: hypothetical protein ABIH65_02690 [Nanoarchaeota archaeon]
MQRLISKHDEEEKRKRNQIIVGIILVVLMVLSVLGFALQGGSDGSGNEETDKLTYNGFEFSYINELWAIGNFAFKYNPNQVPEIGTDLKDATYYQGLPLYIYSENKDAEIEVYLNLRQIAERVQPACLEGLECPGDSPIKTCTDNFIIIKETNNSRITQENNCVYIEGTKDEIVKLVDQFLFKILKIKE